MVVDFPAAGEKIDTARQPGREVTVGGRHPPLDPAKRPPTRSLSQLVVHRLAGGKLGPPRLYLAEIVGVRERRGHPESHMAQGLARPRAATL